MHILIMVILFFARLCMTAFVLIGWWKLGYRNGGPKGFVSDPRTRGFVSVIFGLFDLLLVVIISSTGTHEQIGSSQSANNVALGTMILFFFPWIYIPVLGFFGELRKRFV